MKTTITVGQSVQVFNIGQPEQWNKFGIEREFETENGVDELRVIDELVSLLKTAHDKYSQSMPQLHPATKGDIYFNVTKQKEERL